MSVQSSLQSSFLERFACCKSRLEVDTCSASFSSSDAVSTQTCVLYTGLFLELSFSKIGGVRVMFHINLPPLLLSLAYISDRRDRLLLVSPPKDTEREGVNRIAKVPKRSSTSRIRTQDPQCCHLTLSVNAPPPPIE